MKKLMIAAAIVCAAAVSQAVAFNWDSNSEVLAIDGTTLQNGLAKATEYAVGTTSTEDTGWTVKYTLLLDNGTAQDVLTGTLVTDMGVVWMQGLSSELVEKGASLDYTITYTADIVDGKANAWTVTSDDMKGTWVVQSTGNIGLFAGDTVSTWTTNDPQPTPPTPEPTSALLMLVGMAGLALRRKQK